MRFAEYTTTPFVPSNPEHDMVVLMSGGVDSSVTALILRDQGYNVVGVTMKIPTAENCDVRRSCCGMEAGYVCRDLGIPHYYLDVREYFNEHVIAPFRDAYLSGATPSPCVDCNTLVKFTAVWDVVKERFGTSNLATGHYARVIRSGDEVYLARGSDHGRDQSYFLYGIPRRNLPGLYLPLADLSKDEVRAIAANAGLPVARKDDSMELCFAGEGDYRNALGDVSEVPGDVVDINGTVLGIHNGIHNYTIGQRKGLGIAAKEPLFVIRLEPGEHRVVVGNRDMLYTRNISAKKVNILIPALYTAGDKLYGKIRSQGEPSTCELILAAGDSMSVCFDEPHYAPAPGQRLVLYDANDRIVAGGEIVLALDN